MPQNPYPITGIVQCPGMTVNGQNLTRGGLVESVISDSIDGSFIIDPNNMGSYADGDVIRISGSPAGIFDVVVDTITFPAGPDIGTMSSSAKIANVCWGAGLTPPCSVPQSAVHAGTVIKINTDIQNSNFCGLVRVVLFLNGNQVLDQNTTLNSGLWSRNVLFSMPNKNVVVLVNAYGWDGSGWILTDTKTATIYPLIEFNLCIYTKVHLPQGG